MSTDLYLCARMTTKSGKKVEEAFELPYHVPSCVAREVLHSDNPAKAYKDWCKSYGGTHMLQYLDEWLEAKNDPEIQIVWEGW